MEKPNILFILTDQMRSTAMGCAGEPVITPNLDKLAKEGTRFTNAISNCPSCAPARATLWTGLHTLSHGLVNNELQVRLGTGTFAGALKKSGYRCGIIGKWHVDGGAREGYTPPGIRRLGFDDLWAVANCNHDYLHSFYYLNDDPNPHFSKEYEPVHQTDRAIDFIERSKETGDPFFLVVSWGTPHDPYQVMPEEDLALYPWENVKLPETNSRYVPTEIREAKMRILAGYYAHITALDQQLERLMTALKKNRLTENTIVVFTSDHGDMLGNHGRYFKSQPWRESVGIPLLMKWPGHIPAGRVTRGPISIVDFMPTLLTMVGAGIPSDCEGVDSSRFVLGDDQAAQDSVFINFAPRVAIIEDTPFRGVVTDRYTYAETKDGPFIMYDDKTDPAQKKNLLHWNFIDDKEVIALQKNLSLKLRAWLNRTNDSFEDGDEINARLQPGHTGGVLPRVFDENFEKHKKIAEKELWGIG